MKTRSVGTIIIIYILALGFVACKSGSSLTKQEKIDQMDEKITSADYTFVANRANPMNGQSISLTSTYMLEVKQDTVKAHLPYFGRAYSAPLSSSEGGVKFVSTDFTYSISEKNKGVYRIAIDIKDNPNNYKLSLLVGETGSGTLYITQLNKQGITFYGNIE